MMENQEQSENERLTLATAGGHGEQDASGVDLSLLYENLKLTPTQRWEKHRRSLALVLEVRRAGNAARLRPRAGGS